MAETPPAAEQDPLIARQGDTFPCGVEIPHHSHLFPVGAINVYRCSGDTDTRRTRSGLSIPPELMQGGGE